MTCKQCGENWKKDVGTQELKEEVEKRKVLAIKAKAAYKAKVWPTHGRALGLAALSFIVAYIGTGLLSGPVATLSKSAGPWADLISFLILACIFCVLFLPGIAIIRKEDRIAKEFKKEHPEHAETF